MNHKKQYAGSFTKDYEGEKDDEVFWKDYKEMVAEIKSEFGNRMTDEELRKSMANFIKIHDKIFYGKCNRCHGKPDGCWSCK